MPFGLYGAPCAKSIVLVFTARFIFVLLLRLCCMCIKYQWETGPVDSHFIRAEFWKFSGRVMPGKQAFLPVSNSEEIGRFKICMNRDGGTNKRKMHVTALERAISVKNVNVFGRRLLGMRKNVLLDRTDRCPVTFHLASWIYWNTTLTFVHYIICKWVWWNFRAGRICFPS